MLKRYLALAVIYLFNFFPIKKNKIFFYSYYGSQYGGNPKYITEYILKHYPKETFDIVWALNNIKENEHLKGIRKVKTMSLKCFYELCTSKVIITNYRSTELFVKRKDQYYIQTWHSSLRLKQIEKDAEIHLPNKYIQMAKKDSLKCDLLISGCEFSTQIIKRAFWYQGEILECGTPRNDVLFKNDLLMKKGILTELNIPIGKKVILYAPTFRKNNNLDIYNLEYLKIIENLESKFGGEWKFLVKLHPHQMHLSKNLLYEDKVVDVTFYDDIQELLSIADVLITDYSSLMFDFSITQRPCFLYTPDLKEYIKNERDLYFDIKELPFINSKSMQELLTQIKQFNQKDYREKLINFSDHVGSFEKGNASKKLVKKIEKVCFQRKRRNYYESKAL
ncbi:CDP-glycerol glycerophosphotransferase family protein [Neobacillus sp. M.A.Huq-85]